MPSSISANVSFAVQTRRRSRVRRAIAASRETIVISGVLPTWDSRFWEIDFSVISET